MEERIATVKLMTEQEGSAAYHAAQSDVYGGLNPNVSAFITTPTRKTAVVRVRDSVWNTVDYYRVTADNRKELFDKIVSYFSFKTFWRAVEFDRKED